MFPASHTIHRTNFMTAHHSDAVYEDIGNTSFTIQFADGSVQLPTGHAPIWVLLAVTDLKCLAVSAETKIERATLSTTACIVLRYMASREDIALSNRRLDGGQPLGSMP